MTSKEELLTKDLEKVSGGFEYDGPREWLRGYNIACPFCGCGDREVIENRGSYRETNAYFKCTKCNKLFSYHYMVPGTIEVWKGR